MLTVVRCTRAVVWSQVMGTREPLSVEEGQRAQHRDTLLGQRVPLPNLVVNASGNLPSHGMQCYSRHSLADSQVTGLGQAASGARARRETQGGCMVAHGAERGACAEFPHRDSDVDRGRSAETVEDHSGGRGERDGEAGEAASMEGSSAAGVEESRSEGEDGVESESESESESEGGGEDACCCESWVE
jgi:hypothetical protein